MILKSLELEGFKSFPDKTKLTFDAGVTAVVGPNGSGKSNISDAMKWVLGEVSSKNLRGSKMEDVIFGGTDTRRQMGYAEVSITFDNRPSEDSVRLATDFDEVTVTRRYYRAGDSEYFINAKPVRLRDIHELFLNTGIGREGYSIIGQGKIAEIISRKSDERRTVFEEAAGIAKYKYKKEETEKKLSAVEDNLLRVSDIVSELEGRVGPLEKESIKARKYLELYNQKKEADVSLWLYDMTALKAELSALAEDAERSKNDYERASETLDELDEQNEHLYTLLQEHKQASEGYAAEAARLAAERIRLDGECKVLENEIAHITERLGANENESAEQSRVLEETRAALEEAEKSLAAIREKKAEADALCDTDRQAEAENDAALDRLYERLSALNDELSACASAAGDLKAELSVLESNHDSDSEKRKELSEGKEKYLESIALLEERAAKAKESGEAYRQKTAELEEETNVARAALTDIAAKKKQFENTQNELFLDYTAKKNRIDALSRMEELFEGYSRSVRFIMSEAEHGKLPGATLYGPISKLISVKPKYATAIETALGANIQNIAVADEASAKAAILHLKNNNAGRATFYPLTTIRPGTLNLDMSVAQAQNGYIGAAHTLVTYDKQFDAVIRSLLARTLICDNIDHAAELARKYDYKVRIVTLDGQQVNAGGSFTGGSVRQDSGMLTRTAEIDRLREECTVLSEKIEGVKETLSELDAEAKKHTDRMENTRINLSMIATLMQAEHTQAEVIGTQLSNDRAMLASLEAEEEKLNTAGSIYQSEADRLHRLTDENNARREALQTEREENEKARETLAKTLAECRKQLARHEAHVSELVKDIALAENNADLTRQSITAMETRAKNVTLETQTLEEQKAAHKAAAAENRARIADMEAQEKEAEEKRKTENDACLLCEQKTAALRVQMKEQQHTKELLYTQYTKADNRHNSALEEQDKKTAALWDEYELTYSAAAMLGYPAVTEETRNKTAQNASHLRSQIKALGSVNVSAIEEYTAVKERYDFMTAQVADLTSSKKELAEIIFRLEEEMRTRFSDAMREINHHFQIVFRELFGGGHAELTLSEPDNILESGIEINVAPPGKIIKNLMLLSGGEQAFVAIALYFALLKVNPSPFCFLDEIEAALDEVNVDKFADYLHRNADKTQFIVITHRRGTMETADRLYGVTMVDKGISTVLSVKTSDVGSYVK